MRGPCAAVPPHPASRERFTLGWRTEYTNSRGIPVSGAESQIMGWCDGRHSRGVRKSCVNRSSLCLPVAN